MNNSFANAVARSYGPRQFYLTHSTNTGLIAPVLPPDCADVIVNTCPPDTVAAYLRRGCPVVVTGSKFFNGPAFSRAVSFPRARLRSFGRRLLPSALRDAARLGRAVLWTAAPAGLDAFHASAASMAEILSYWAAAIEPALASNQALVPIGGLKQQRSGWADLPSISTFGMRDATDRRWLLLAAELRPLYEHLAQERVLLGQPVGLGPFGNLRVAFGARDRLHNRLPSIFAALKE